MKRIFFLIIFTLIFSFSIGANQSKAQIREGDVSIQSFPSLPGKNQDVRVVLSSFVFDLNKSTISWSINGEERLFGIGRKEFSFNTGELLSNLIIRVEIGTSDGQNITKSLAISSSELDMLWEAYDVYTPPFYKGKAMVPKEGIFKVVAMPNIRTQGQSTSPRNLSYLWKENGNNQPSFSGWGKNYFLSKNTYLDAQNSVSVTISNLTGEERGTKTITLAPSNPKIVFYKSDPILGVDYNNSIKNASSIGSEGITIKAEPYFFSPRDINEPELEFTWSINKIPTNTPTNKSTLSLKPEQGVRGSSSISLAINNVTTFFQEINKTINLSF